MPERNTLVVFGATSPIGVNLAELAAQAGLRVVAVVRAGSDASALNAAGAEVVRADALDAEALSASLESVPAAAYFVSTLGGKPGSDGKVDWEGNRNAIDIAAARQAARFVLVTTVGAGDSRVALPEALLAILGPLAEQKTRAETHLNSSGLNFTILRPGHLMEGPATGRACLVEDPRTLGAVRRSDLAALILRVLDASACQGRSFAVTDQDMVRSAFSITPFPLG